MKKKEFREPETLKCYGTRNAGGSLFASVSSERVVNTWGMETYAIPVRIIRERDYRRLLRLAKGGGRKR